ncbi:hypothetical protein JT723_26260 [Streptomyces bryophytorum]|nr:hypothetical protein [Actinacidiphila bryophytorum]
MAVGACTTSGLSGSGAGGFRGAGHGGVADQGRARPCRPAQDGLAARPGAGDHRGHHGRRGGLARSTVPAGRGGPADGGIREGRAVCGGLPLHGARRLREPGLPRPAAAGPAEREPPRPAGGHHGVGGERPGDRRRLRRLARADQSRLHRPGPAGGSAGAAHRDAAVAAAYRDALADRPCRAPRGLLRAADVDRERREGDPAVRARRLPAPADARRTAHRQRGPPPGRPAGAAHPVGPGGRLRRCRRGRTRLGDPRGRRRTARHRRRVDVRGSDRRGAGGAERHGGGRRDGLRAPAELPARGLDRDRRPRPSAARGRPGPAAAAPWHRAARRLVPLQRRPPVDPARRRPVRPARPDRRPGGAQRGGQEHPGEAAVPLLRPDPRGDPVGRRGHPRRTAAGAARPYQRGLPGLRVLRADRGGEHRGGRPRARRGRGAHRAGGAGGRRPRHRHGPAARLPHSAEPRVRLRAGRGGGRGAAVRRAVAAARAGPRLPAPRPRPDDPRRTQLRPGPGGRVRGAPPVEEAAVGAYQRDDLAPARRDPRRRPDRGAGRRCRRGGGRPHRAAGRRRCVRPAVQPPGGRLPRRRHGADGSPAVTGALAVLAALVVAAALAALWLRGRYLVVTVHGESMLPTYRPGERVLVRRTPAGALHAGQVVVLSGHHAPPPEAFPPGMDRTAPAPWIIKRVTAVPGDPIPRDTVPALRSEPGTHVPAGRLVVLGDNPARSHDSRRTGYVAADRLYGVAVRKLGA